MILVLIIIRNNLFSQRSSTSEMNMLWVRADGAYPIYTLNSSLEEEHSERLETYAHSKFYLNLDDKYVRLVTNLTPDGTQNLQMLGIIPDARSGFFDIWREYEDIRVTEITSYLRMNHSRLITSQFIWRPSMKQEVKDYFKLKAIELYDSIASTLDYWKKTLYSETVDSYNGVWEYAKPYVEDFLKDVG